MAPAATAKTVTAPSSLFSAIALHPVGTEKCRPKASSDFCRGASGGTRQAPAL
jgi:hypothetical protein